MFSVFKEIYINYNFSITEKEDFLSSNLNDLISNLNFIPIDVVTEVSCGTPSYAFNEMLYLVITKIVSP